MAGKSVIKILIDGDTRGLDSALGRTESRLGRFARSSVKSFAVMGAAVVGGSVLIGKRLIEAAEQSAKTDAKVKNITESMGLFGAEAQNVADRLLDLATKTGLQVGVDDDVIKSTQAKLLTFKELAASADEVGGAFDRATMAAVDLAAAGFGTAESNAVQLGKALNDPVKGIAALTRAGITFTEAEKERIKTLVESGDLLAAQQMVLGAIETQVGGTAAATATASSRMGVAFGELQEALGAALLPAFEKFTTFLIDKVFPAGERLARTWGPVLGDAFRSVWSVVRQLAITMRTALAPTLAKIGDFFAKNQKVVKAFFTALAGGVVVGAIVALAAGLAALLSPAVLITVAIAALVAGVVYAWNRFEVFREVVTKVVEAVKVAVEQFVRVVKKVWAEWGDEIVAVVKSVFGLVSAYVDRYIRIVRWVIEKFVSAVQTIWRNWGEEITAVVERVWGYVSRAVQNALDVIRGIINTVTALIRGDWSGAWNGIKTVFAAVWDQIKNILGLAWDGIKAVVRLGVQALVDIVKALPGMIGSVATSAFDGIKNAFTGAINWIIGKWNGLEFTLPKVFGFGGWTISTPDIPLLAQGGIVTKPTLAVIGEAGPEAVVPLNRMGGMGGPTINIYMTGTFVGTEVEMRRAVKPLIPAIERELAAHAGSQG